MRWEEFYGDRAGKGEINLISVQSVKGGVGKTMIALLLADVLRERDEGSGRVVVIDLDFSGTSIADVLEDPRDESQSLHDVKLHMFREGGKPITLLHLFTEFLKGTDLARSLPDRVIETTFEHGAGSVFHFASGRTFDTQRDEFFASVLFDATHAEWFVDFLFDLFGRLEAHMRLPQTSAAAPLHIVLDNAPGQSELLPLLQERLLRWGRHRAKFIQVASLDEMDLKAGVAVLSRLNWRAELLGETKEALVRALYKERGSVGGWTALQETLARRELDRTFFDEVLAEGRETAAALARNREKELQSSHYLALVVNRVYETVDLERVGNYVDTEARRLAKETANAGNVVKAPMRLLPDHLCRESLPFDPGLALFFQGQFLRTRRESEEPPDDPGGNISVSAPRVAPSLQCLADCDDALYQLLFSDTRTADETSLVRSLARVVDLRDVSHVARGFRVIGDLLDACHDVVCGYEFTPSARVGGLAFRLAVEAAIAGTLRDLGADGHRVGFLKSVRNLQFANDCLKARLRLAEVPGVTRDTIKGFRTWARDGTHQYARGLRPLPPALQAMLYLVFPVYGVFVAYDTAVREPDGKLDQGYGQYFKALYGAARIVCARAVDAPAAQHALLGELHSYFSTSGKAPDTIIKHAYSLGDAVSQVRRYANSLSVGTAASETLAAVAQEAGRADSTPTPLTELYVRSAALGLFDTPADSLDDGEVLRLRRTLVRLLRGSSDEAQAIKLTASIRSRLELVIEQVLPTP